VFSTPAFRALWTRARSGYAADFTEHVDGLVRDVAMAEPLDFAAQIKATVAQLRAGGAQGGEA
jgi:hypothetical protein